jgi:hypothetical protein
MGFSNFPLGWGEMFKTTFLKEVSLNLDISFSFLYIYQRNSLKECYSSITLKDYGEGSR